MIPDIPRFDGSAFEFYIALMKLPVIINRLDVLDEAAISSNDYILLSEGSQGFAEHYSRDLKALNDYVLGHPESFHVVEWFALPNGEVIRLYRVGA
jgi:hypothetical protein